MPHKRRAVARMTRDPAPHRARLHSKGSVVIPRALRERAAVQGDDQLIFTLESGGSFRVDPAPSTTALRTRRDPGV